MLERWYKGNHVYRVSHTYYVIPLVPRHMDRQRLRDGPLWVKIYIGRKAKGAWPTRAPIRKFMLVLPSRMLLLTHSTL
jgi:hypothetical protein